VEVVDKNIYREYQPEIVKMKTNLQTFLVDQKTENFKLIKEIAILEKEKNEIQQNIYVILNRIHKIEKDVGLRSRAFTYLFDQSLLESQLANKIFIEKEDI
jgi:septal ring factor EnvC (AmiA/AmiB activator)